MKWKTDINFVNAGFVFALLILLVLSISSYRLFKTNEEDEERVKHTYKVLQMSKELLSNLKDAETGQRGYIITGNEQFLEPFYVSVERNDNLLNRLKKLTLHNSAQQLLVREITLLSKNKFFELKKTVELRRDNQTDAAIATIKSGKSREIMERIRFVFDKMDRREQQALIEREHESKITGNFTKMMLICGVVVSITILVTIYLALHKQLKQRRKNERALYESKEWFSKTLLSIGDGVIATDHNFMITFMNPIAEALTGWKEKEAKGKPVEQVFQIVNEHNRTKINNPIITAITEKRIVELANHTILIKKDKTEINIDDSASPVVGINGNISGAVLVFRDVTEQKKREKKWLLLTNDLQNFLIPVL